VGLSLSAYQSAMAGPDGGCAFDRPCIFGRQDGSRIIFDFTGDKSNWDFFNVRYATRSGEKQVENRSGVFTFNNVMPNLVYTLKVEGMQLAHIWQIKLLSLDGKDCYH
jgi:hypothetical protein